MQQRYLKLSIVAMRVELGVIFLWFGFLKFYSPNPVYELLKATSKILKQAQREALKNPEA